MPSQHPSLKVGRIVQISMRTIVERDWAGVSLHEVQAGVWKGVASKILFQ